MSIAAAADLEGYRAASRAALEAVIDRFARVEQAADLEPGSMVETLLEYISSGTPEEVIGWVRDVYELKEVPGDWEELVEAIIEKESA